MGFNPLRREGIELAGSFVASVNVDLKPGTLEEATSVTGAAPILDVQSAVKESVLGKAVTDNIPTSGTHFSNATTTAAASSNNPQDVGGLSCHFARLPDVPPQPHDRSTDHGRGPFDQQRRGAGQFSGYMINTASTQEMTVEYAGGGAEAENGGVRMNAIPKQGGNRFTATMNVSTARGGPPDSVKKAWITAVDAARGKPVVSGPAKEPRPVGHKPQPQSEDLLH